MKENQRIINVGKKIVIKDMSNCYHCGEQGLLEKTTYCPTCNFPQRGSEKSIERFFKRKREERVQIGEAREILSRFKKELFYLSVLFLVGGLMLIPFVELRPFLYSCLVLGGGFILSALLFNIQPVVSTVVSSILILVISMYLFVDPVILFPEGIIHYFIELVPLTVLLAYMLLNTYKAIQIKKEADNMKIQNTA